MVSGDKGFAGAFNANILKVAFQFIAGNPDKEIDIEAVGRKGRDQMRRRYPVAGYAEQTDEEGHKHFARAPRQGKVELTGDHPGLLVHLDPARVEKLAHGVVARYVRSLPPVLAEWTKLKVPVRPSSDPSKDSRAT